VALPPLIAAMCQPELYRPAARSVELVQTHISYVLLVDDQVYKIKKAVRFAFLDFSTLERRRHFCAEEVRLNRRLTTDVYRGVVGIALRGDFFVFVDADAADAVEVAVHMRRLPDERMLSALLRRGAVDEKQIDAIAARLVAFHAAAAHDDEIAANGAPETLATLMERDFAEVMRFHGVTIGAADDAAIRDYCLGFLARHDALLRRRQRQGRIRDCHGDLRAEHICVGEPLQIVDCIEFEPKFRHRDVACEVGFLAMDIEYEGRPDLAQRLVDTYARLSGDGDLGAMVPFYQCYLAYIRGKVDSLKSTEPEVVAAEREAAAASAVKHFALSYRYTWAERPLLVVVAGLSGTGKSTLAAAFCARSGFAHFNSDVIRKQLAGLAPDVIAAPQLAADLYSPERSRQTYATMIERAGAALGAGRGAVIDATFQRRPEREAVRTLARTRGVPLLFVECVCDEKEIRARLNKRVRAGVGPSDADWEVYRRQVANAEPLGAGEEHVRIDTSASADGGLAALESAARAEIGHRDEPRSP